MGLRVLLLSNGGAEDAIAAAIASHLVRPQDALRVEAFPLVGTGGPYRRAGWPVVGVQRALPSGGFARLGVSQLWADLKAGLVGLLVAQMRWLARARSRYDVALAVGDILPLALGAWFLRRPVVFHSTAKSDYIRGHLGVEVALMRRHCPLVLARDEVTARSLVARGVPARCLGNVMMDLIPDEELELPVPGDSVLVALLPGSRADAYDNLLDMLPVAELLSREGLAGRPWAFAAALSPGLDAREAGKRAAGAGWRWAVASPARRLLDLSEPPRLSELVRGSCRVLLVHDGFGSVLRRADVCLGLAGTANEQAVGLGKPVVAFPGRGIQYTPRFLAAQKRLLGDGLLVCERDPAAVAAALRQAASDPELRERVRRAGEERMGPPGAAARIARELRKLWKLDEA